MGIHRRVALAAVFVLVVAACSGSDTAPVFDDSTTTSTVGASTTATTESVTTTTEAAPLEPPPFELGDAGRRVVDTIIGDVGDAGGIDAILLAFERGYALDQLMRIGVEGVRLDVTGILRDDSGVIEAAGDPLGLIAIDEGPSEVQSLWSRSLQIPNELQRYDVHARFDLRDVRERATISVEDGIHPVDAERDTADAIAGWILLVASLGYGPDQIVEAIMLGGYVFSDIYELDVADRTGSNRRGRCHFLYIGSQVVPPAFENPDAPYCKRIGDGIAGPGGPSGVYAPATRVGGQLVVRPLFSPYVEPDRREEWFAGATMSWTFDGEEFSTAAQASVEYDHGVEEPGEHTVGLMVRGADGSVDEFTTSVDVLEFFDVGLGPISVLDDAGSEFPVSFVMYSGETMRFMGLVQGFVERSFVTMKLEDPGGERLLQMEEMTEVDPPDLGVDALRAWVVDHEMTAPALMLSFRAYDFAVGEANREEVELLVTEPPANPTAWGGGDSCSGEDEGAEYSTQWQVRMTDNGDGTWTADIYYHDCPDRGRAHYRGSAVPITPYRWLAEVEFVDGRGPLGGNAPNQMPGPLTHYLISGFGFENNVQETIGVR